MTAKYTPHTPSARLTVTHLDGLNAELSTFDARVAALRAEEAALVIDKQQFLRSLQTPQLAACWDHDPEAQKILTARLSHLSFPRPSVWHPNKDGVPGVELHYRAQDNHSEDEAVIGAHRIAEFVEVFCGTGSGHLGADGTVLTEVTLGVRVTGDQTQQDLILYLVVSPSTTPGDKMGPALDGATKVLRFVGDRYGEWENRKEVLFEGPLVEAMRWLGKQVPDPRPQPQVAGGAQDVGGREVSTQKTGRTWWSRLVG